MNSDKVFYIIITVITVVLFGGIIMVASKPATNNESTDTVVTTIPQEELVGTSPNTNLDIEEAKVVIVEFSDFQCPACKSMWSTVSQIKTDFGSEVAVVYRQFPLTSIHNYALKAARASEAAGMQGKFYEYHDVLFRNQQPNSSPLKDEDFISFAEEVGLDIEKFKQDIESEEVKSQVDEDRNYATAIGINSTPTFFIDGVKINHSQVNLYDEVKRVLLEKSIEVKIGDTEVDVSVETNKEETPAESSN